MISVTLTGLENTPWAEQSPSMHRIFWTFILRLLFQELCGHQMFWCATISHFNYNTSRRGISKIRDVSRVYIFTHAQWGGKCANKKTAVTDRGEMIHLDIGASRYFVYDTIHRYKYENIDTKRYDFAVKDTRATWRVPREVVNAMPALLVQHTRHAAEQRSWISVI